MYIKRDNVRIKRIILDEKLWLENFQGSEILFYRRYVDDTFRLFHSEHDSITSFDYINSRHPNIGFTMEKEAYHKLPFLDVLVNNNDPNSPLTSVYRLLLVLYSAPRGFSPGTPVFPSHQKPTLLNSNSIWKQ